MIVVCKSIPGGNGSPEFVVREAIRFPGYAHEPFILLVCPLALLAFPLWPTPPPLPPPGPPHPPSCHCITGGVVGYAKRMQSTPCGSPAVLSISNGGGVLYRCAAPPTHHQEAAAGHFSVDMSTSNCRRFPPTVVRYPPTAVGCPSIQLCALILSWLHGPSFVFTFKHPEHASRQRHMQCTSTSARMCFMAATGPHRSGIGRQLPPKVTTGRIMSVRPEACAWKGLRRTM